MSRRSRLPSRTTLPWKRAAFTEGFQAAGGLVGCGTGEVGVLVGVDRGHEVLAAGEGLPGTRRPGPGA